jgi:hypothetical protein
MPSFQVTPIIEAAKAQALIDMGHTHRAAAAAVGLAGHTVYDIMVGNAGWAERKNEPLFKQYRAQQKGILEHGMTELAKKMFVQAEKVIHKASTYQAVVAGSILIDKVRLLQGEPTLITANLNIQAVANLDKLAAMFSQRLVEEQTPVETQQNSTIPTEASIVPSK